MNPPPAETASPSLDPTALAVIVRAALDAIPHQPDAPAEEIEAKRRTAYDMIGMLRPRDLFEAMLAGRIVAGEFHIIDAMRRAAEPDLAPNLGLRFRASANATTRMVAAARADLTRRQAYPAVKPAALPVAMPAPCPPAPPTARPVATVAPHRAAGGFVPPTEAKVAQLVAAMMASEDARIAAAQRRPAAADPVDDDDLAEMREAEAAVARACALMEETAPPAEDMGERLQAEVAARAAAAATKLAA